MHERGIATDAERHGRDQWRRGVTAREYEGRAEAFTYLSLFSGIGGLDLAVESSGFECVGQVEWDEHCTRVLKRWWPTVRRWGDIAGFGVASYADQRFIHAGEPIRTGRGESRPRPSGTVPLAASEQVGTARFARQGSVDLLIGGFPCQPASHAGKRKGTTDDRWLWPEFARVVGELGPRYVLVENVPGLLTVNGGRAFSEVLGDLASLGYDTRWTSLRAADVGACHRRERIFLLAERADADGERSERTGEREGPGRTAQPGQLRDESQRLAGDVGSDAPDAAFDGYERSQRSWGRGTGPSDNSGFPWGAYAVAIERAERAFGRPAPWPVDEKGRLSPVFVEWMMGFPEGWVSDLSRTQALKALGNAVVPQQGAAALSILMEGGAHNTPEPSMSPLTVRSSI